MGGRRASSFGSRSTRTEWPGWSSSSQWPASRASADSHGEKPVSDRLRAVGLPLVDVVLPVAAGHGREDATWSRSSGAGCAISTTTTESTVHGAS